MASAATSVFALIACVSAAPSADLVTTLPGFNLTGLNFKVYSGYLTVPVRVHLSKPQQRAVANASCLYDPSCTTPRVRRVPSS